MNSEASSDEELYRRLRKGDEKAFAALYGRRQGQVYRFALQLSGSRSVAEDVTQETFLAVMRNDGDYDASRGALLSWLYGMARKICLRAIERRSRHVPIGGDEEMARYDTAGALVRDEQLESLREAVLALPVHYREVVVLCDLQEMSYAEAARAIGCPEGTVRSRLHRARGFLMEKLRCLT